MRSTSSLNLPAGTWGLQLQIMERGVVNSLCRQLDPGKLSATQDRSVIGESTCNSWPCVCV